MLAARTYSITELCEQSGFDRRTIVYYIQQGLVPKAGRRGPNTRYPEDVLLRLRFVRGLKDLQDQGRSGTITLVQMRGMLARLDAAALRDLVEGGFQAEALGPLLAPAAPAPAAPTPTPTPRPPTDPGPAAPPATRPPAPSLFSRTAPPRPAVGDGRSYGLADANIRNRFTPGGDGATGNPVAPPVAPSPAPPAPPVASSAPGQDAGGESAATLEVNLGELLRELELRPTLSGRRAPPGGAEQWTEIPVSSRVYLSVRGLSEADAPLADAAGRALKKLLRAR